ncbi:MAG: hypothetical protein OXE42_15000 [Gammaproteobacteria bacterium]|nr:hypothetical protein [Gammaproteobacteria bacterium]
MRGNTLRLIPVLLCLALAVSCDSKPPRNPYRSEIDSFLLKPCYKQKIEIVANSSDAYIYDRDKRKMMEYVMEASAESNEEIYASWYRALDGHDLLTRLGLLEMGLEVCLQSRLGVDIDFSADLSDY